MLNYKKYKKKLKTLRIRYFNMKKITLYTTSYMLPLIVFILLSVLIFNVFNLVNYQIEIKKNINKTDITKSIVVENSPSPTENPTIIPTEVPKSTIINRETVEISRGGITRPSIKPIVTEPVVSVQKVSNEDKNVAEKNNLPEKTSVDFDYIDSFIGNITMYTLAFEDCGKHPWDKGYGIGASGIRVTEGVSVAMGKQIPFNTKIRVEGFDEVFVNQDTGSGVGKTGVDIFTNNRKRALEWGRQFKKVYIISWGK